MLKVILLIINFYFVSSLTKETTNSLLQIKDIGNLSKHSKLTKSEPIDISFINRQSMNNWPFNIIENIYNTLRNIEFINVVSIFNVKTAKFTNKFEELCLQIMEQTYKQNIFYNFKDDYELTNIQNKKKQFNEIKKNIFTNTYDTLITAATSTITGDINTPILLAGETAHKIYKYIKDSPIITTNKSFLVEENVNQDLYSLSKIYCTNIATIKIEIFNDNLYIVGDKVDKKMFLNFISIVEKNIEYTMNNNKNEDFVSLLERINVLKDAVIYLSDISGYMMYNYLTKSMENLNYYEVKNYFINILNKLNDFVSLLNIKFPLQEIKINKTKEYIENEHYIKMQEKQIEYLTELYNTYQKQIENKIESLKMNDSLYNFKSKSYVYIDYYAEKTKIYAFGFKNILKSFTKNILMVPSGIAEGAFDLILSYLFSIFLSYKGIFIILLVAFILNFGQIFTFICRTISKYE